MLTSLIKPSSSLEKRSSYLLSPITEAASAAARMYAAYFGMLSGIARIDSLRSKEFDDATSLVIITASDLSLLKGPPKCSLVVFMTDLIRLDSIVRMESRISLIITTSALQSRIMSSVLPVECFTALEPIDPFFKNPPPSPSVGLGETTKVVLFGYSNSLERTSAHLAPFLDGVDSRFETIVFSDSIPPSFRACSRCRFLEFSKIHQNLRRGFCYVVLSDVPVDLSVSTLAKSDNKLISSIQMGCLPLIVKGSRYLRWLPDDYPYIFSNPLELLELINKRLDIKADIDYYASRLADIPGSYHKAYLDNVQQLALALDRVALRHGGAYSYPLNNWPGEFSYGLKDSLHALRRSFSQALFNRLFRLRRFFVGRKL